MLLQLFKPAWKSSNPQKRRKGLSKLNPEITEQADTLFSLASTDPEQSVRLAAIERIKNITLLVRLLKNASTSLEQDKLGTLLCKAAIAEQNDIQGALNAIELIDMDDELHQLAFNAQLNEVQMKAAQKILKPHHLVSLSCKHPLVKVRQEAAQRLDQPKDLQTIYQHAKGRDKSVWRIVQEKLDALKKENEQVQEQQDQVIKLLSSFEDLSNQPPEPLIQQKQALLNQQWDLLEDELTRDHQESVKAFNEKIQQTIEEYEQALADSDNEDTTEDTVDSITNAEFEQQQAIVFLEEALSLLKSTPVESIDVPSMRATLTTQKSRWAHALELNQPSTSALNKYDTKSKELTAAIDSIYVLREYSEDMSTLHQQLETIESDHLIENEKLYTFARKIYKALNWPSNVRRPMNLQTFFEDYERLEERKKRQDDIIQNHVAQLEKSMNQFTLALEAGQLNSCQKIKKNIHNRLLKLPEQKAESFRQVLKPLYAQYAELKDWQAFAAQPKKEALVESMEGLAEDKTINTDPMVRFEYIQRLQNEWKALGQLPKATEQKLWDRFQKAANLAFEPCKSFFEQQASQRKAIKAQQTKICEHIAQYLEHYNWTSADWPEVQNTIKTAKTEWRQLQAQHLEEQGKPNRGLNDRFYGIIRQLESKLDAHKDLNLRLKQKILDKAQPLLEHEDLDEALQCIKKLREEWRSIGMLPRDQFKAMNQSFNDIFDALNNKKQKLWSDISAQKEHNAQQIEQILDDRAKQLQTLSDETKPIDLKLKQTLEQEMNAIEAIFLEYQPITEKDKQRLLKKSQKLYNQFELICQQIQSSQLKQTASAIRQRGEILRTLETLVLQNQLTPAELFDIQEAWNATPEPGFQEATPLNARFDAAISAYDNKAIQSLQDKAALAGQEALSLCIRLEILAGIDSPIDDQQQRMQLQVNRLNQSLTSSKTSTHDVKRDAFETVEIEWHLTGPLLPETYHELQKRVQLASQAYQEDQHGKNS